MRYLEFQSQKSADSSGISGLKRENTSVAGSKALEIQSQKSADPIGILSKSEQREEAGRSDDKACGVQESSGILGQKTQK